MTSIQKVAVVTGMANLDALRDWGHAKDYVRMQWMMLQQEQAEYFVIATGKQYSVRNFVTWTAAELGWVPEITAQQMCGEMVANDLDAARHHALLKAHGHDVPVAREAGA